SKERYPLEGTFSTDTDTSFDLLAEIQLIENILGDKDNGIITKLTPYCDSLVNVVRFVAQLDFQHTDAYPPLLRITEFDAGYQAIVAEPHPDPIINIKKNALHATVKRLTGVDLDAVAKIAAAKKAAL